MKKYILYTFFALGGISLLMNLSAFISPDKTEQVAAPAYILVEVYEIPSYNDKGVHIHWGNNKTEIVPFKDFKADNHDENGDILLNTINRLTKEGYEIEHTASGLAQSGMITKLFMRKK